MRLGELEGIVGEEDGYSAESDAAVLLQGLDIPDALHERTMAELQGGQKVRVLLAQALFGQPAGAAARRADQPPGPRLDPLAAGVPQPLRRHADRHLARPALPERHLHAHRRHRLRDDHHVYRRLRRHGGGQDPDPDAIEAGNAQREKKIAQLNEFIARFGAGTRASQVTSRRKEVERLQTTELARSNIQRPYIRFPTNRPSGKVVARVRGPRQGVRRHAVISGFGAIVNRGEKIVLVGRNGAGKTTMLKALLADAPDMPPSPGDLDAGTLRWGHEVSIGYFPQDHTGVIEKGLTAVEWLHRFDPEAVAAGHPRPARPDALQRRRRPQADRGTVGRRNGAAALLPHHAAEAERAGARRADQPSGSRGDQRAEHRAAEVRRHGVPRHARQDLDEVGTGCGTSTRAASRTGRARTRSTPISQPLLNLDGLKDFPKAVFGISYEPSLFRNFPSNHLNNSSTTSAHPKGAGFARFRLDLSP